MQPQELYNKKQSETSILGTARFGCQAKVWFFFQNELDLAAHLMTETESNRT